MHPPRARALGSGGHRSRHPRRPRDDAAANAERNAGL